MFSHIFSFLADARRRRRRRRRHCYLSPSAPMNRPKRRRRCRQQRRDLLMRRRFLRGCDRINAPIPLVSISSPLSAKNGRTRARMPHARPHFCIPSTSTTDMPAVGTPTRTSAVGRSNLFVAGSLQLVRGESLFRAGHNSQSVKKT